MFPCTLTDRRDNAHRRILSAPVIDKMKQRSHDGDKYKFCDFPFFNLCTISLHIQYLQALVYAEILFCFLFPFCQIAILYFFVLLLT